MTCTGTLDDHCCHLGTYGVCGFLAELLWEQVMT